MMHQKLYSNIGICIYNVLLENTDYVRFYHTSATERPNITPRSTLFIHLTGFHNFYSSGGSISCLNIWNSNLTSQEMLEAADCSSQGDVYHLAEDTIYLHGNVTSFTLIHPDYLSQRVAGKWKYLCTMMIA